MTDLEKAARMALKGLERSESALHKARAALRQALEQPAIVSRAEEAYEAAKQREWVGLTDEEIHDIYDEVARREPYNMAVTRRNIARAIEANLKEKNS